MNNDQREHPADSDNADETLPSDEPEADELQRKVDEIERKVADGN